MKIVPSSKEGLKFLASISGPTKAGKTYTALRLAMALSPTGNVVVIDTERGRSNQYDGLVVDGKTWHWQSILVEPPYSMARCAEAVALACTVDPDVIVFDGISQEWAGKGGALDEHTAAGGRFQDWGKVTPTHNEFIDALIGNPFHTIVTMRSKMDYAMVETTNGTKIERLGLKPVQRDDVPYEFDFEVFMDQTHTATIKTRYPNFDESIPWPLPGPDLIPPIMEWLGYDTFIWKPEWPAFVRLMKPVMPLLLEDCSDDVSVGKTIGALLKKGLGMQKWDSRQAMQARDWLAAQEAALRISTEAGDEPALSVPVEAPVEAPVAVKTKKPAKAE